MRIADPVNKQEGRGLLDLQSASSLSLVKRDPFLLSRKPSSHITVLPARVVVKWINSSWTEFPSRLCAQKLLL